MRRRRFLQLGLFGGALLAVSGTGLALFPSRRAHVPRRPLLHLDELEFAILAAVAARVIAVPGADPVAIAHDCDAVLDLNAPESRADVKRLLRLLENGLAGLLLDARPSNFTRLDGAAQDAALYAFRDSRLVARRSGYHALKKLCAASFYSHDSTWSAIGYPGPPTIPEGAVVPR
jgi:hypothetical protein